MRRLAAGAVTLGLVFGGALGAAGPAVAANAVVAGAGAGKSIDACTGVPDTGDLFDFTDACLTHDSCYIEQPHGSTAEGRKRCDQEFRAAMMAVCQERHPGRSRSTDRRLCKAVAIAYYLGVRVLGGLAWDQERPAGLA
jgi:hypothetical protein